MMFFLKNLLQPKKNLSSFLSRRCFTKTHRGVSMLVALILVGVLLLFGLIISNVVISAIRDSANVNRSNQAFYAAEGALEEGLYAANQHGAGYSDPAPVSSVYAANAGQTSTVNATYKIQGQVDPNSQYADGTYGVPSPGTGDVGSECDPLTAVISGSFEYPEGSQITYNDYKDHPCNWNKISVGETVTIPLYYTDQNGDAMPLMGPNSTLQLKIRTACTTGEALCVNSDRYDLDYINGDPTYSGNDPIINWQILGDDLNSGQGYVLNPWISFSGINLIALSSTIISESKIDAARMAMTFKVLDQSSKGIDLNGCIGKILDFIQDSDTSLSSCGNASFYWSTHTITKPVFNFTIIHSMEDTLGRTVPYLEYQLISNAPLATPTDVAQTVMAEGFSGSFKQVLQVQQPQASGLLQYVIQQ